jgi:hypothetical protein
MKNMENEKSTEPATAIERLRIALPYIFAGFEEAKGSGIPTLMIAARQKMGGGKMIITINDPEDLLRDIAEVAGISLELAKEQKLNYKAQKFLSSFT